MLNDAAVSQFKKIYLAPDIRIFAGGSMDWLLLSAFSLNLILMIKMLKLKKYKTYPVSG